MKQIGRYHIVRELGRGGMGVVFEGRGPDGARVAIKMLLEPERGNPERFQREAEVLRFLGRHPGIVTFREAGFEGGHPFLAMEYVQGQTLAAALEAGLPRDEALGVLVAAARALHFAHEAQVVHRDVKPENVLLDAAGRAILSDFGVAKCLHADRLTLTGEVIGTPAYMAPEQLEGEVREVDRRTDVYALGAVLYEVLSGARPFTGSKIQVAKQVLLDSPPPLAAELPPDLCALTLRCLAKEPERRPQTAEEVACALEAHLGASGELHPAPVTRGGGARLALASVCLVLGLGVGWAGRGGAVPAPAPAPEAGPAPEASQAAAPHEAGAFEATRDPAKALARAGATVEPSTASEAWGVARRLRDAARLDPEGLAAQPQAAPRLVAAANQLLAAVDPRRAGDARLVHEARDCLLVARLLAPQVDLRGALGRFTKLRQGSAPAVRRAASPWRDLWSRTGQVYLDRGVVERALKREVPASALRGDPAKREDYPAPWGAVVYQLRVEAIGNLEVHDQRLRYRIFAELYLERQELAFMRFVIGEELLGLGRVAEGRYLLEQILRGAPKPSTYGNYLTGRYLCEWLRDPEGAERYLVSASKRNHLASLFLASALLDQGGLARQKRADGLIDGARMALGRTLRWHAEKVRAAGPEEDLQPIRERFAQKRLEALRKGPAWE